MNTTTYPFNHFKCLYALKTSFLNCIFVYPGMLQNEHVFYSYALILCKAIDKKIFKSFETPFCPLRLLSF